MINLGTSFLSKACYTMVALFCSVTLAMAQPEYSNGPLTGSGGNSIPWAFNSSGVRGQQLWPAGAFGTVPSGKYIKRIYYAAYPGASPPSTVTYSTLEIAIGQPNISSLGSSWATPTTVVLSESSFSIYPIQGDWHVIELTTPIEFDPSLPLLVDVKAQQSSFQNWYNWVKPSASSGAYRAYAVPHTSSAPTGSGSHEMYFGFDLVDGLGEFPYCEGFEDGDGGWTVGGILPSWEHGEPDNTNISSAANGTNCWVTDLDGDHNNDEASFVLSPLINLEPLVDPVIKFNTIRDLESGDDGVQFQVSADSGATYSVLGSTSSSNWYNSSSVSALSSLGNGNGWTGETSAWVEMRHSLSSYAADTAVFLRFLMAADGNTTNEGFGFDDIVIAESDDIAAWELFYPDSACGTSATTVSVSICNISVDPKYGFSIDIDTNGTVNTVNYTDTLPVCGCDTVELINFNSSMGGYWTVDVEIDNSGDVNAANDTLSADILMYATPAVSLVGGGNYCEGEVDTLTFYFEGTAPWNLSYTNGTNPNYIANITNNPFQLLVSQPGTYSPVYITDASGCPADTSGITGEAVVNFFPAPVIDLGPDSSVCEGYVLDAGPGFNNYQWSTGETTQQVTASQTNIFSVTVTDSIGCTGSDVADLEVFPTPVITLSDTVLCEGSTFLFNAGGGAASYVWHNGASGQVFQIDSVGTVSVTVTSFFGCQDSAEASITAVVPNPSPSISSTSSLAPVTLDAGAGYIAYKWNTNATTQTISVSVPGTYTCTVTDQNGCKGDGQRKAKIWPTGLDENSSEFGVQVFPNPNTGNMWLSWGEGFEPEQVELMDASGRVVHAAPILDPKVNQMELKVQVAAGTYLLKIHNGTEAVMRRVLIAP